MSGLRPWSPVPRGRGPEFLAVWAGHPSGFWRLAIYGRGCDPVDSVYTDTPFREPRPGDHWLAQLKFVPAGDGGWAEGEGGWVRAVAPASSGPGTA
jgi:hypothetical protein